MTSSTSVNPRPQRRPDLASVLHRPVDAAGLAIFRVLFGAMMATEAFFATFDKVRPYYDPDRFHFTYEYFHWVRPLPIPLTYIEIGVMGLAALALAVGAFYRWSAAIFVITYTHLFLIEKALYNNHYYLIILLGVLFLCTRANATFALDAHRPGAIASAQISFWNVLLFRAQFVIVYTYAGLAKLNADWLHVEPIRHWLAGRADTPQLGPFFTQEWCVYFFAYGGLLFDLLIGPLLVWRRTRPFAMLPFVFFHLTNHWLFDIGVFPWLALAGAVVFFPPDAPRRWLGRLGFALPAPTGAPPNRLPRPANFATLFVIAWIAIQVFVPLRPYLLAGNPSWTEAGREFSWQMKIRDKRSIGTFWVLPSGGGDVLRLGKQEQLQALSSVQRTRMLIRPQMILQFAHFLRDSHHALGMKDPKIFADVRASLNGRPYQPLIDPTVDLGAESYPRLRTPSWILPLKSDLTTGEYPAEPPEPAQFPLTNQP